FRTHSTFLSDSIESSPSGVAGAGIEVMRILFRRATIIFLIGLSGLALARSPIQEFIVHCSPEALKQLQARGSAIIDAIPSAGGYLVAMPSAMTRAEIKAAGKGIQTSRNFELTIESAFPSSSDVVRLQWDMVPFYTSNVPTFYLNQPSAGNVEVLQAHRLS